MGSGTNISCGRRRLWCSSSEDGEALVEQQQSTNSSSSSSSSSNQMDCPNYPSMMLPLEESEKSVQRCSRRQQTPTFSREWLFATILLIILNCDMVWSQYAVVQASEDVLRSSSSSSSNSLSTRSDVEHISEIYNNKNNMKEKNNINNDEELRTDNSNAAMGLSESEVRRIQDLVLRGLNITRIPSSSEVSANYYYLLEVSGGKWGKWFL